MSAVDRPAHDTSALVIFNGWQDAVPFKLPPAPGEPWTLAMETNNDASGSSNETFEEYLATGRSVLVFLSAPRASE